MVVNQKSSGRAKDAKELLRYTRCKLKLTHVADIQFKETTQLGEVYEMVTHTGEVCGEAWFDSNGRAHVQSTDPTLSFQHKSAG
jgi:hypothetical protein